MKKLLFILFLIALNACYFDDGNTSKSNCAEAILYNVKTDNYVNALLDIEPESIKITDFKPLSNEIWFEIYYYDCKFGVKHYFPKPYVNDKEGWDYGAIKRDGSIVMLDGGMLNLPDHKVSDKTLLRLQNICLNSLK